MRIPSVFLFIAFSALCSNTAFAAPQPLVDKPSISTEHNAVTISPHRAIYDLSLSSIKNGSNIADISGKMIFEWADACDGWAIQQNLHLHFNYAEGDASNVDSNEVTWEAKDGKRYNFNIRRVQDGKETENYRGKATFTGDSGKALYTNPEGKAVGLTSTTVFPSTHTKLIIEKALAGEHFFTRRVFDGTDEGGSNDVSVFIGAPKTSVIEAKGKTSLDDNLLLSTSAYPVHMAFFKLNDDTGVPDYEMDLQLLTNGVARTMKIDYGDFSVTGTLEALEPFPNHIAKTMTDATAKLVMIVEDNDLNAKLFRDLLEAQGYRTLHARDGMNALDLARKNHPNLILMDIQLPEASGLEVTQWLKNDEELKIIPIIAVTAFAMKGDEERIRAGGCEGYLSKPIAVNEFLATVKRHLAASPATTG